MLTWDSENSNIFSFIGNQRSNNSMMLGATPGKKTKTTKKIKKPKTSNQKKPNSQDAEDQNVYRPVGLDDEDLPTAYEKPNPPDWDEIKEGVELNNQLEPWQEIILNVHNELRAQHGAPPLTWNSELADYALVHTDQCIFEHSRGPFGENLALGHRPPENGVLAWYNEIEYYNYAQPGFSMDTGHFTQLVWAKTAQLGCALVDCKTPKLKGIYLTCEYFPPGNIKNRYNENVFPPTYKVA